MFHILLHSTFSHVVQNNCLYIWNIETSFVYHYIKRTSEKSSAVQRKLFPVLMTLIYEERLRMSFYYYWPFYLFYLSIMSNLRAEVILSFLYFTFKKC